MSDASCTRTASRADWYAERGTEEHDAAMTVCRHCPVRSDCLEYALATGEQYGLWGGASPAQRDRIRAQRQRRVVVTPGQKIAR